LIRVADSHRHSAIAECSNSEGDASYCYIYIENCNCMILSGLPRVTSPSVHRVFFLRQDHKWILSERYILMVVGPGEVGIGSWAARFLHTHTDGH